MAKVLGRVCKVWLPALFVVVAVSFGFVSSALASSSFIEATPPLRVRHLEYIAVSAMMFGWSLSIPYFIYTVALLGFKRMFAFGDSQKEEAFKERGGNIVLGFALVFGGYLAVRITMQILGFQDPNECFNAGALNGPIFQFFFPASCT